MKKELFAIVTFAVLAFTSCRKDRTCTCAYSQNGVTIKETITYHKVSDKTAKTDCTNQPLTVIDSAGTTETVSQSCVLN